MRNSLRIAGLIVVAIFMSIGIISTAAQPSEFTFQGSPRPKVMSDRSGQRRTEDVESEVENLPVSPDSRSHGVNQ